jgi:hypothetical protein
MSKFLFIVEFDLDEESPTTRYGHTFTPLDPRDEPEDGWETSEVQAFIHKGDVYGIYEINPGDGDPESFVNEYVDFRCGLVYQIRVEERCPHCGHFSPVESIPCHGGIYGDEDDRAAVCAGIAEEYGIEDYTIENQW